MILWPMPEVRAQFDSFRQTLSMDTRNPFDLKPGLLFFNPQTINPLTLQTFGHDPPTQYLSHVNYDNYAITPPTSASASEANTESPVLVSRGQPQASTPEQSAGEQSHQWIPNQMFG